MSGAYNAAQLNIDGVLGGYLAHEFVPAKTHEGAVGGELLGAIGNFILPGGLGSFLGTILGTLIFNHFGTRPSPGAVDLLDQAGNLYGSHEYQASDHGTYDYPDKMAPAADAIINAYLRAVNGVALDHYKQVTLGYIVESGPAFYQRDAGAHRPQLYQCRRRRARRGARRAAEHRGDRRRPPAEAGAPQLAVE